MQCNDIVINWIQGLPQGSTVYVLVDTTKFGLGKNVLANFGLRKFKGVFNHDQAITLTTWKSDDRGATWTQVQTEDIASPGATVATVREWLCEGFPDFRATLTNGGSDQNTFKAALNFTPSRNASA